MKKKIICIILARTNSKRFKNKNFYKYKRIPLINYTLKAALKSKIFDKILISTDKKNFKNKYKDNNIEVQIRNKQLSKYALSVNELVLKIIKTERLNKFYDLICVLYPTAILRNYLDIQKAYNYFKKTKADSIIAATNFDFPAHQALIPVKKNFFFQSLSKKYNSPKYNNLYKKTFVDNGSLYLSKIKTFINLKTFYSKKLCIYYMPRNRSLDINYKSDIKKIKTKKLL